MLINVILYFFFQAEDGIRDFHVTGVQTCALPIFCPASVWKLFTTTAALKILGSEFRFRTILAYDGKLENGILSGNVYIIGGGDRSEERRVGKECGCR